MKNVDPAAGPVVPGFAQRRPSAIQTFYSSPINLGPGHMIYTDTAKTPLTFPTGNYAVTGFHGDIVDADHNMVPLSKVYDHRMPRAAKIAVERSMRLPAASY